MDSLQNRKIHILGREVSSVPAQETTISTVYMYLTNTNEIDKTLSKFFKKRDLSRSCLNFKRSVTGRMPTGTLLFLRGGGHEREISNAGR
jgi:hypothetical protein